MLQCLLLMLFGSIMFVDPEDFLDKTNDMAANMHRVVGASFGWQLQFLKERPLKNPRHLAIAVRVVGGAMVATGTVFLYSRLTGLT